MPFAPDDYCLSALTAEEVQLLENSLQSLEVSLAQAAQKASESPEFLGKLAGEGKSLKDLPDILPGTFSVRVARLVLKHVTHEAKCRIPSDAQAQPAAAAAASGGDDSVSAVEANESVPAGPPIVAAEAAAPAPEPVKNWAAVARAANRKEKRATARLAKDK